MKQYRSIIWLLISILLVLFAAVERFRFLLISSAHLPITGDEALAKLKAMAIADGERPLLFWGTPYQFPLESYILSSFIDWLPSTELGARIVLAFFALVSVCGFVWLARLAFPARSRWPVVLLILFPSTYVLTLQSAYFIPQHTMTMAFFMLLSIGVILASRNNRLSLIWIGIIGICAGMALSTHLLSLPLVAATFLLVAVGKDFRQSIHRLLVFLPTFVIGLLPYLLTYEDASQVAAAVTGKHSFIEAIQRFFSPVLWDNLTAVLGFDVVVFPEPIRREWDGYVPVLLKPLLVGFWLLLACATLISFRKIFLGLRNEGKLVLSVHEFFVAAFWASLLAFCFSERAEPQQYRYLLPAAWGFPFLFGVVYTASSHRFRMLLGAMAVLLATLNVVHSHRVMNVWQKPDYAAETAKLYDLDAILTYLEEQQISTCYANFWLAYRITYTTQKRIFCDQPYNGRFYGWPLPFKDDFDLQERVAFVLSNNSFSRLRAKKFLSFLKWHRVEATIVSKGPYYIFHDFRYKGVSESRLIDTKRLSLNFSGAPSKNLAAIIDGDRSSTWCSAEPPLVGDALELRLNKPSVLHRVRIFFEKGKIADAPMFRLEVLGQDGDWIVVRSGIKPTADRLEIYARHTRFFYDDRQDISFKPVEALAVRLVVEQQVSQSPWSISEIQLSEDAA